MLYQTRLCTNAVAGSLFFDFFLPLKLYLNDNQTAKISCNVFLRLISAIIGSQVLNYMDSLTRAQHYYGEEWLSTVEENEADFVL